MGTPSANSGSAPPTAGPGPVCRGAVRAAPRSWFGVLGIGVTLLAELRVPAIKIGRRCVYDVLDLDAWLNEYKQRGRAGKEKTLWPVKPESTGARILAMSIGLAKNPPIVRKRLISSSVCTAGR